MDIRIAQGLHHPGITPELALSREADLRSKVASFAAGEMSWDALMGTFVELVDESFEEGAATAITGRLQHYFVGYMHGLNDRDDYIPMEDA